MNKYNITIAITFVAFFHRQSSILLFSSYSFAGSDQTFFGPKRYDLPKGNSKVYTDNFTGCNTVRQVTLKITNGSSNYTRIQSANIALTYKTILLILPAIRNDVKKVNSDTV